MTYSILFLAFFLTSAESLDDLPTGWVKASSKDEKVSFIIPGQPVEKFTTQKIAQGPIEVQEYSVTKGDVIYRVEKTTSPVVIPETKLAGALAASRDAIQKKTKILDDRETSVNGWPARELLIEAPLKPNAAPSKIAMLIFYADNEFYQVRVFALKPGDDPKDVRLFFDSVTPAKSKAK